MPGWREEIEGLIEHENRAWNDGDAGAYSEAVAPDCVFTNIFGQVFVGRDAFEQQHARVFANVYKGSHLDQTVDHLRLVRPGVALVDTSATLSVPPGDLGPARQVHARLLQVLVHDGGAWRIASYHNVEERPRPPDR
jgi:uncharacterized protein (TIGR02246 family)